HSGPGSAQAPDDSAERSISSVKGSSPLRAGRGGGANTASAAGRDAPGRWRAGASGGGRAAGPFASGGEGGLAGVLGRRMGAVEGAVVKSSSGPIDCNNDDRGTGKANSAAPKSVSPCRFKSAFAASR